MATVFISHSSKDQLYIEREIVPLLENNGIGTWYCREEIITGEQWQQSIVRGLVDSDWFLLALSPRAEKSRWVKREVDWAFENRRGRIVPVIIEACRPARINEALTSIQHVNFHVSTAETRRKLLQAFGLKIAAPASLPFSLKFPLYGLPRRTAEELLQATSKDEIKPVQDIEAEKTKRLFQKLCRTFLIENPDALQMFLDSELWQSQPEDIRQRCEGDRDLLLEMAVQLSIHELIPIVIRGLVNTSDQRTVAPMVEAALRLHRHLCSRREWQLANAIADVLWPVLDRWGRRDEAEQLLYRRYEDV